MAPMTNWLQKHMNHNQDNQQCLALNEPKTLESQSKAL